MRLQLAFVAHPSRRVGTLTAVLVFLLTFFFIYSVEFAFLPIHTSRIVSACGGFMLLLVAIRASYRIPIDRRVLVVMVLLGSYVTWVAIRTALTGAEDMSLLIAGVLILIQVLPGAAAIAYLLRGRDLDFDDLIRLLYLVIVVQAGFIVLSFFSLSFKEWTLAYIPETSNVDPLHPFRVRGLTHGTGAKLSAFQGAGLILATYLLINCRGYRELAYLLATSVFVAASILLTGRTGVFAVPLAVLLLAGYAILAGKVGKKAMLAVMAIPLVSIVGFVLFQEYYLLLGGWNSTGAGGDAFQALIEWFTEEFFASTSDDLLGSRTIGVLLRYHWFLPDDDWRLFVGDPNTWTLARIHSDVGPVRMLFGAGLVGTALVYSAVLAMFVSMLRWSRSVGQAALFVVLAVWMALVELKEPYFIDLRYLSLVGLLFFFMCLDSRRRSG